MVACRRASSRIKGERGIYVKHFKNIPMADMEIVLVGFLHPLPGHIQFSLYDAIFGQVCFV